MVVTVEAGSMEPRVSIDCQPRKCSSVGLFPRRSTNPFALLVACTLHNQATRPDSEARGERKFGLVSGLYDLGLTRSQVVAFFRLVDHAMKLSPSQETMFKAKLEKLEKEKRMPYITSIERMALEEGREQGREQGRQVERLQSLKVVLEARFGPLPAELSQRLQSLSAEQSLVLLPLAATEASLDQFAARASLLLP